MELTVNQPTKQVFTSAGLIPGLLPEDFSPIVLLDGVAHTLSPTPTYTEIGSGVYTLNFTPSSTGRLIIFLEGRVQVDVEIVTKTLAGALRDISDESLGSWSWNKVSGLLTLYKSDSSVLATYNVVDTLDTASRERVS